MVKLTFYGGVGEIGGNKILLDDNGTRIFLDFGKSFTQLNQYYANYLNPRSVNGIGDYFEFDILPKLEGLYQKELLNNTEIKYTSPKYNAVLISHPHVDHIGFIPFLDEDIPVYCGEMAKIIIKATEESTYGGNFGKHVFKTFHTGDKFRIGSIEIEPIHVDHSVPGAYGYIINTSSGAIVYTGDLRMHGIRSDMTEDFICRANKVNPLVLITEATRVMYDDKRKNHSEKEVGEEIRRIVPTTDKMIIAAFYGKDLDRFKTFYNIAKEFNKKFVISTRLAHLLSKVKEDVKFQIANVLNDDTILVYKRRKKSGEYDEKDYQKWERAFLDKAVNYEYVNKNQGDIIFNLDLYSFTELIDVKPDAGSHFIHSMSEPWSEEDINDEVMHRWLEHFGLEFHQIHASGHCAGSDIKDLIHRINSKRVIPIHTECPKIIQSAFNNTLIVERNKEYVL